MSDDFSTRIPNPPELQPLASSGAKLWKYAPYLIILMGFLLIGWGGWSYYQDWLEANQPPPARIVESPLSEMETSLPTPTPTPRVEPNSPAEVVAPQSAASTPTSRPPIATPTPTVAPSDTPAPPTGTARTLASSADEAGVLSLEDNPLPVADPATPTSMLAETPATDVTPTPTAAPLTRIVAESIGLDAPVVEVGWKQVTQNGQTVNVWEVAEYAAGWHKNSRLPGQGGNIVLSGHNNIKGEVFRYIVDLEPGAVVSLFDANGRQYDYVVADKFIVKDKGEPEEVRRANARWIGPFNEERLTLVTCWPYNNNTHRVIVIAKPAE